MYFFNVNELKQSLINEPLSQTETFKYLLAYLIIISISQLVPSEQKSGWDYFIFGIQTLITIFGTYYAFKANNKNNGKYFLQRYLSLNFVLQLRYGLLCIIFFIPILLILRRLGFDKYLISIFLDIYVCFFLLIVYCTLVKYISIIADFDNVKTLSSKETN